MCLRLYDRPEGLKNVMLAGMPCTERGQDKALALAPRERRFPQPRHPWSPRQPPRIRDRRVPADGTLGSTKARFR